MENEIMQENEILQGKGVTIANIFVQTEPQKSFRVRNDIYVVCPRLYFLLLITLIVMYPLPRREKIARFKTTNNREKSPPFFASFGCSGLGGRKKAAVAFATA